MNEKIQLLNPDPNKQGATISVDKYEIVKHTILQIIEQHKIITFKELMKNVSEQLRGNFDGSPSWYCTAVKLDLEARKIIERIDRTSPQKIRLVVDSE